MTARFSVIVPCHSSEGDGDRRRMLHDLLASVPNRPDIEIILIDDNSHTTPTLDGLPSSCSGRVLANTGTPRSAGAARNTGLAVAQGAWLIFADNDDLFTPGMERVLDAVTDAFPHWIYDLDSFEGDGVQGDRHVYMMGKISEFDRTGKPASLLDFSAPVGRIISRAFIAERGIAFEERRYSNDVEFVARVHFSGAPIGRIPIVGYTIRGGHARLTSAVGPQVMRDRVGAIIGRNRIVRAAGLASLQTPVWRTIRRHGGLSLPATAITMATKGVLDGSPLTKTRLNRYLYRDTSHP